MDASFIHPDKLDRIKAAFGRGETLIDMCREEGVSISAVLPQLSIRMAEHAISARHVFDYWPRESFDAILKAQRQYDAGLSEMCQGRCNNHFVLYSIPRKRRIGDRKPYFSLGSNL